MRRVLGIIVACCLTAAAARGASVQLVHEHAYSYPSISQTIRQLDVRDMDLDGLPEVIVRGDFTLLVHDLVNDNTKFTYEADGLELLRAMVVDDLDGDGYPDLILGRRVGDFEYSPFSRVIIDWFEGNTALNLDNSDTIGTGVPAQGAMYLTTLRIPGNNFPKLMVSFDSADTPESAIERTIVYDGFPYGILWSKGFGATTSVSYQDSNYGGLSYLTRHWSYMSDLIFLEYSSFTGSVLVTASGTRSIFGGVEMTGWDCPYYNATSTTNVEMILAIGRIHPTISRPTAVAWYYWNESCGRAHWNEVDSSGYGYALFEMVAPDTVQVIWQQDYQHLTNPFFHEDYPGFFFALDGTSLNMYGGINGAILNSFPLPGGRYMWSTTFPDSIPRFLVYTDSSVAIYHLDVSTDIGDESDISLPKSFALGAPYPNPFNGSIVLPVSNDCRQHVRIDVVNTLGQKIATVFDEELGAGEKSITWDAGDRPSGVYFIRAITDSDGDTKKVIYLK